MAHVHAGLSADPLDVPALIQDATDPESGGLGIFIGTVRKTSAQFAERNVLRLEYDAHEGMAAKELEDLALEAASRWPLRRVVALHRTGICPLGEPTVVVACSAPHRAEALEACRFLIDSIKGGVAIFKKEIYADGSSWAGMEGAR